MTAPTATSGSRSTRWFLLGGLLVAVLLAAGISQFASSEPDGLERVAADHALNSGEQPHDLADSPLADYGTTGFDPRAGQAVAGVVGLVVCFGGAAGVVALSRRARRARPASG